MQNHRNGQGALTMLISDHSLRNALTLLLALLLCHGCDRERDDKTITTGTTTITENQSTSPAPAPAPAKATVKAAAHYVGSQPCQSCHMTETEDWRHSDHAQAMMPATNNNVLANFANQTLAHHHQQTRFDADSGQYRIHTDQQTASPATLPLSYTFGVFPLQQYLTALADGRWQALPFAWDSRPQSQGGQRWFHLYQHENITLGDPLHWRAASHGANHMCIECHTTNFVKNFHPATNSYTSQWQEAGVGCESCHGPGSRHIDWAHNTDKLADPTKGWGMALTSGASALWQHQQGNEKPKRLQTGDDTQVERCAQCHSRRSRIDTSNNEKHLLDAFLPSLLEPGLYHADGQIQDEVYEYGSFLQSRMHQQGVTCSNCHNPHSGKPKVEGNGLCLQCHSSDFNTPQHTLHTQEKPGSFCIDCHMPTTTYMQVDARRDHSLRVPRPDLTESLGTPNACNNCHTGQSAAWATANLDKQHGTVWRKAHAGQTLAAARERKPASYDALIALIKNMDEPAIVRASALSLLPGFPQRDWHAAVADALNNADALLRLGAMRAAEALPPQQQLPLLTPLLDDERRALRIEAARVLAGQPSLQSTPAFVRARSEYIASQNINADRAAALTNLAMLAAREQRLDEAETQLKKAIALEPYYIPASINLADLYRATQRDAQAQSVLQTALRQVPDNADLHFSYALWLVRQQQTAEALPHLQHAVQHSTDPYYRYVLALALQQQGKLEEALHTLDAAAVMPTYLRDVHALRVDMARTLGDNKRITAALAAWKTLDAQDPALTEQEKSLSPQQPQ